MDSLRVNRSVIAPVRSELCEAVIDQLTAYLTSSGFDFIQLDAQDVELDDRVHPDSDIRAGNPIASDADVVLLEGLGETSELQQTRWFDFLAKWSKSAHRLADKGSRKSPVVALLPVSSIKSDLPEPDLFLEVLLALHIPSVLEVRNLCRVMGENCSSIEDVWRESVLPPLVGNDVSMTEHLWDAVLLDVDDILCSVAAYGEGQWSGEDLSSLNKITSRGAPGFEIGTAQQQELLRKGLLLWTPEYGREVHPSALALLRHERQLSHRLWRGQASLILPYTDDLRLGICECLTKKFGSSWPYRWHQPHSPTEAQEVRKDTLACQWGHIDWLMRSKVFSDGAQELSCLVSGMTKMRNQLAHFRPVSFREFRLQVEEATYWSRKELSFSNPFDHYTL